MVVDWSAGGSSLVEMEDSQLHDADTYMREIEQTFQLNGSASSEGDVVEQLVAHCDASTAQREGRSPSAKQERLVCGLSRYLHHVEELGIVSGVVIGWLREEQPGGYLWNVLREAYRPGRGSQPDFQKLNGLASELEQDLSGVLGLSIAHVSPEKVQELLRRCDLQGIDTRQLTFSVPLPRT